MPLTVECCSGGGGRHLYFAHPGGLVRNKVALAAGVDLRGDGGYVVAPPSVHASGARYVWRKDRGPGDAILASPPDWLLRRAMDEVGHLGRPTSHWRQLVREGVSAGERNNTIASLAGHLMRHGVDTAVVFELLLCWNRIRCKPPLVDEEVAAVVRSIGRLHAREAQRRASPISRESYIRRQCPRANALCQQLLPFCSHKTPNQRETRRATTSQRKTSKWATGERLFHEIRGLPVMATSYKALSFAQGSPRESR
jgi:Bifunctional DNA primase/polymerase, N-terminal/Primase C terminal 1 (PriCT-1)